MLTDPDLSAQQVRLRAVELAVSLAATGRLNPEQIVSYANDFEDYVADADIPVPDVRATPDVLSGVRRLLQEMIKQVEQDPDSFACDADRRATERWLKTIERRVLASLSPTA